VNGHLYIVRGDLTHLSAHAVAYSASHTLGRDGNMYSAFRANVPGFDACLTRLRGENRGRCEVGDTFWMPLQPGRKPHGIVLAVSTSGRSSREEKAGLTVRSALSRAVGELRAVCPAEERLLIGLPTFRCGLGGDRRQRLRSARAQITAALEFLEQTADVDVAFVPYTVPLHQIFLEARRELLAGRFREHPLAGGSGAVRAPELEQALQAGECVLFVGAGLSRGSGLPDWGDLIRRLSTELGLDPARRVDYLDLAQWYRERFGREALAGVIHDTFSAPAALPTLAHYLLMSLPVRHVVTTNYDDLLERALLALKRHPIPVVRQEDVARPGEPGVFVVKLHGDAGHPEEVVLTRDDYEEFFERRPALALLLEGLLLNRTFFFVGYGLRDPNFRQIHGRIARMLREAARRAFATSFEAGDAPGDYLTRQWQNKQVHLIPIPGTSAEGKEQVLLRFLDELADHVNRPRPQLFLAPEVAVSPPLRPLRDLLIERVGEQMEQLGQRDLARGGAGEARYLGEVLRFLADHGWRPTRRNGWDLSRLWEYLADHAGDGSERRRYLIAALESAEAFADVERIRGRLEEE
jgi:hypothetical protein